MTSRLPDDEPVDFTVQIYPDKRRWNSGRGRLRFRFVGNNNEKLGGPYYNLGDLAGTLQLIVNGGRGRKVVAEILDRRGKVVDTFVVRPAAEPPTA